MAKSESNRCVQMETEIQFSMAKGWEIVLGISFVIRHWSLVAFPVSSPTVFPSPEKLFL
jgi:hypothetical protein